MKQDSDSSANSERSANDYVIEETDYEDCSSESKSESDEEYDEDKNLAELDKKIIELHT